MIIDFELSRDATYVRNVSFMYSNGVVLGRRVTGADWQKGITRTKRLMGAYFCLNLKLEKNIIKRSLLISWPLCIHLCIKFDWPL